jgi:hypothetical protein
MQCLQIFCEFINMTVIDDDVIGKMMLVSGLGG